MLSLNFILIINPRGMHKKIYDTDLGYEGIKMDKIKKNAMIFFVLFFFHKENLRKTV